MTTPSSNALTLSDILELAKQTGIDEAKGKDGQPRYLLKIAEAAFVGALDNDRSKHGTGIDDAQKLTKTYVTARTGANIFDVKALNSRVAINRTRTMIKLGMWPKGGPGEPLSTLNSLMTLRDKLRKDNSFVKRIEDPTNCMLRFARAQLKRDSVIDVTELQEFCLKRNPEPRSAEDFWEQVRRTGRRLAEGKLANCPEQDTSDEMKTLLRIATKRLTDIAKGRSENAGKKAKGVTKVSMADMTGVPANANAPDGLDNQTVEATSAAADPVLANTGFSTAAT